MLERKSKRILFVRAAEVFGDVSGHYADFVDGRFELLGGAIEVLGPIAQLVGLVDIDAGAVGGAAVLKVVGHSSEVGE